MTRKEKEIEIDEEDEKYIEEIIHTLNTYYITRKKLLKIKEILIMTEHDFKNCFEY